MDMVLAIIAGLGTFIGLNMVFGLVTALACGASQFMNVMLRFSYFALPIRMLGWFTSAWIAIDVGASIVG
ncbi:hypothetical protein [Fulvimarina manganoxydans]|nr:hypothetical protein [Fulvimarina manganoxydans]